MEYLLYSVAKITWSLLLQQVVFIALHGCVCIDLWYHCLNGFVIHAKFSIVNAVKFHAIQKMYKVLMSKAKVLKFVLQKKQINYC